ncbi:MAG TPA: transposase domain-containing protein [Streptosporangiaceae bacterium]|nr:transposase domain-containing protein [Streptosporangiaceae bacterium]
MLSYLPHVVDASRTAESPVAGTPAGTVVVRAAGLRVRGGTVTAGGSVPSAGELAVFCRPVVTAPAVARRDGTVLAGGWLPDSVRLGELERHLGDGVIEAVVAAALEQGRLKERQRRRLMSYPLVIRLMIAMTLTPDASYCEALARLAGLLADIPFALEWHIPTEKVITDWRLLVPADLLEALFWRAAGPLVSDDEPSAVLLAGMVACAADGMLVNLADTPQNRAMFGSAGTGDDSAPFPQLRIVALTARAGRAMLGAILGSCRAGEQTLLRRLIRRRPDLVAGRVICFDRNFPGHELITAILDAGGHVVARVKAGISLPMAEGGGWLPDGSRLTWLNATSGKKEDRLPVRAAEHNAVLPCGDGKEVPETCTVITTLPGHEAAPADAVRETYLTRWSASETTFGEDKATITGAGDRTSGPVLRSGSPRLVISEAWAWLTATQLARASAAAALRGQAAAARALRRRDSALVTADEESFTAVWRHAVRSMTSTQVTASSSLQALAAAADAAARAALHTLNIPGRQRHSERARKARPKFPHATAAKTTVTGKPEVTVFAPGSY